MKLGQKVKWSSQSAGFRKMKYGKIIEIVYASRLPITKITTNRLLGGRRNHKSFVVKVGERTYWPLAKYLQII